MNNKFASELVSVARERFSIDSKSMTMADWIEKNTSLKKQPFSFKGFEFQRKIVNDMHEDLNVIKISQVGLTEVQIRKALGFLVRNKGTSLIFSLPDEDMYQRVSKGRIKPIVQADKVFNTTADTLNKSVRSTEMMQFDQSFLYIVPANESAATSISADFIMNDEVDLSDQSIIGLFSSRLQASKYKIAQKFSTPSFPSFGIDMNWQISDQQVYKCRCSSCGFWNNPEFNKNFIHIPNLPDLEKLTDLTIDYQDVIDLENSYVKCYKCHNRLDLDAIENREWVSTYPNRLNTRGYKITPFVNSNLTVKYIINQMFKYQKSQYMRGFYNTVLGLPYSDGDIQIAREDIIACMTGRINPPILSEYDNLWIGIDMGQTVYITIGTQQRDAVGKTFMHVISFYTIKVSDIITHIEDLCKSYKIIGGTVDRHPYEPTSREIFERSGRKIIPLEYRGLKDYALVDGVDGNLSHAQVNPAYFIDNVAIQIKKRRLRLSGYQDKQEVIIEHYRDMVRSESPDKPTSWVKLHGTDHFLHATGFLLIAPEIISYYTNRNSDVETRSLIISSPVVLKNKSSGLYGR